MQRTPTIAVKCTSCAMPANVVLGRSSVHPRTSFSRQKLLDSRSGLVQVHSPLLHTSHAAPTFQALHTSRQHALLPGQHKLSRPGQCDVSTAAVPEIVSSLAASPYRDAICLALSTVGATVWVKLFNYLASNGYMDQKLSRKLVHSTAGPLLLLTWPFFSAMPAARYIAAVVPTLNFLRLLSVGSGVIEDKGLVKSVSRSGDRGELLQGPLYYCIVLIATTILCWRENPAGLIAVSLMCGGDGLADIVGRRYGSVKLPYNGSKSVAGSLAMLSGGLLMSFGLGFFECYSPALLLPYLVAICLAATVVESLPINQFLDDNLSVPLVAAASAMLLLPYAASAGMMATAAVL